MIRLIFEIEQSIENTGNLYVYCKACYIIQQSIEFISSFNPNGCASIIPKYKYWFDKCDYLNPISFRPKWNPNQASQNPLIMQTQSLIYQRYFE